ncbi:hypothetical protein DINM_022704 [Dirofilaria immitis]|nr:hypothetical protein [Dirofilaria immitis]
MSSSSWEIQEDCFDDVDSENDEKLSVYEDDLYVDDHAVEEHQNSHDATFANHLPPRLSTIAEESNIGTEGRDYFVGVAVFEGNDIGTRRNTYVDSVFGFGLRRELSIEKLQRDQESFYKYNQLAQDDFRFNEPCLEKENSWEPSIPHSPPPTPKICVDELAAFNITDSHLIPAISSTTTTRKEASQDIENVSSITSSHMRHMKRGTELEQNSTGPKMSTPKSADTSLRDLSINCISSIYPETFSPKSIREINSKFCGHFVMSRRISKVVEEPSLSSSAIDRVLEKENFDNDDALVEALLQAKTRPRLKLKFSEVVTEERSGTNMITRHDRSGITNKMKKPKTVEDSLRQTDAENQGKFLSCDHSFVYFGFVDIKCRVNRAIRLRNISSKSLNLRLKLHSMNKGYELLEQDIVVLKPDETHLIHVVFQPLFGACFQNSLHIRVLNAEHINYSVPLLGSGGVAALRIVMQSGLTMLRDGSFVLIAQGVKNISFDVENKGLRQKAIDRCTIAPSDCVSILHRNKQKFSIEVPSLSSEENNGNSNHSFLISSFSTASVMGNTQYYVQLLWGEEAQRRRLKRYENKKCANFTFNGHTFTKCKFINEEECKSTASEDACYGCYDRDAFELGLRVTLISVVDNRLSLLSRNSYLPQEEVPAESVILEPNAAMSPAGANKSVVEDVSTILTASRFL